MNDSHKVAQWRVCKLHTLSPGPGAPARGGQSAGSPATGLFGAACMSTEAFLGQSVQAKPFFLPASKRSDVLRQAEVTCFLEGKQPRLWLLGNSSVWAQLASLLTGGRSRVSVGGSQRRSWLIAFWRACVPVCMCVQFGIG